MPSELRAATLGFVVGSLTGAALVAAVVWWRTPVPSLDAQVLAATQDVLEDYARTTRLRAVLAQAATARVAVAESVHNQGRFPTSNAEAGLPPATAWQGDGIAELVVGDGGVITVTLSPPLAGQVQLRPDLDEGGSGSVRWYCSSPDIADLGGAMPDCQGPPSGVAP